MGLPYQLYPFPSLTVCACFLGWGCAFFLEMLPAASMSSAACFLVVSVTLRPPSMADMCSTLSSPDISATFVIVLPPWADFETAKCLSAKAATRGRGGMQRHWFVLETSFNFNPTTPP